MRFTLTCSLASALLALTGVTAADLSPAAIRQCLSRHDCNATPALCAQSCFAVTDPQFYHIGQCLNQCPLPPTPADHALTNHFAQCAEQCVQSNAPGVLPALQQLIDEAQQSPNLSGLPGLAVAATELRQRVTPITIHQLGTSVRQCLPPPAGPEDAAAMVTYKACLEAAVQTAMPGAVGALQNIATPNGAAMGDLPPGSTVIVAQNKTKIASTVVQPREGENAAASVQLSVGILVVCALLTRF
ncbi:hypothetical protein IWQ60_001676 [Tieghemiomyces parasiticus]|uniref:Uncharacterized protein n=1 Tax=Tieghemiomyces parasiticus TaxID=78921 RepID=A0A9W8AIX3_9FUNG|nr:hypothetical protein IWQ60_001676 [Tieghemiomyces parasiticus]